MLARGALKIQNHFFATILRLLDTIWKKARQGFFIFYGSNTSTMRNLKDLGASAQLECWNTNRFRLRPAIP
jgi:hypothetical protein